jgi:D-alanine-D-alanine ligase
MERRYKKVAVLMGGVASEREVSLRSGRAVAQGLREGGYVVEEVDVTSEVLAIPEGVEAVFIALHGCFGEDGGVQRVLESLNMPYTGSGVESSRVSFDKVLTRDVLMREGIPVAAGELLVDAAQRTLPLPVVVKPPREGSSVGCHLVSKEADWPSAFEDAAQFSGDALVESYIPGRELTVGIVGGEVFPVIEICTASTWYDFEAKYVTGTTRYVVPAEVEPAVAKRCQELALKTFNALGAEGLGRVDFRLNPANEPFVLELNSIPGFTASSLLPKAAAAVGIGFSELCCRIMEGAHL